MVDLEEANESRKKIIGLVRELSKYFVGRDRKQPIPGGGEIDKIVFLMAVSVVAREPILILGEPGTAKSDMVVRFTEACGARKYFEHTLTMFTEPSEIIGPVNIHELKKEGGRYNRILDGRIADAEFVFLDEIFRGNSAILNLLLTLMNEHKVYQGTEVLYLDKVDPRLLTGFFAASNEIPDSTEILPLKDRFPIKVWLKRVPEDQIPHLIQVGVQNDIKRISGVKPWADKCSIDDFLTVRKYLIEQFSADDSGNNRLQFPEEMDRLFLRIIKTLRNDSEYRLNISDRQVIKLYRLIATYAFLERGAHPKDVEPKDMVMMQYTTERLEEYEKVSNFIRGITGN